MTGSYLLLLALGAVLASAEMVGLWVIQVRTRDASHVDVGWAVGIAAVAVGYALLADGDMTHRVLAAVLATVWGLRLGLYLLVDRVLGKEEDGRYRALRGKWGTRANRNFFLFFQFQAVFVVFFSVPFLLISLDPDSGLAALEWVGTTVWAVGNCGAITADRQLARWRSNPGNRGHTARAGPVGLVAAPELLLRVDRLVRRGGRRDRGAVGLDRMDRSRRPPLPAPPGDRHPRHRGAGAPQPCGLRRYQQDDQRVRAASTAGERVAVSGAIPSHAGVRRLLP